MRMRKRGWSGLLCALVSLAFVGCEGGGDGMGTRVADWRPTVKHQGYHTDVLIYQGVATAYGDAEALASIAQSRGLSYDTVSSDELDAMSYEDITGYGAIVWPGGYAGQMSNSLNRATRDNLKRAVNEAGMGFVGICAGAFIAISPDTTWGLSIIASDTLPYYHLENEGTSAAMTPVSMPDGSSRDLVWWGGPTLLEFPGGVLGRYQDTGEPAITQSWAGNGLVMLAGPHPEAPADWRAKLGLSDSDGMDQAIAADMMVAALRQEPMPAMN